MSSFWTFLSENTGAFLAAVLAVVMIIFLVFGIVKISKPLSWVINGIGDLFGEPARPGVPARPGILERQQSTDEALSAIADTLAAHSELLKELGPNHGSSIKDVTAKTHAAMEQLSKRMDAVETVIHITPPPTININNTGGIEP